MQTIDTIDQMVAAFGGAHAVGGVAGVGDGTVYVWKVRGRIPARHLLALSRAGRSIGVYLADALFERIAPADSEGLQTDDVPTANAAHSPPSANEGQPTTKNETRQERSASESPKSPIASNSKTTSCGVLSKAI